MKDPTLLMDIAPEERTPLVELLLSIIKSQSATIEGLEKKIKTLESKVEQVEADLKKAKKITGKPLLKASKLERPALAEKGDGKRPGSAKRSKKSQFQMDEERIIEPESVPLGARFNGYREYDVQELLITSHGIRFKLAEYVSAEGDTVVGQLPVEYEGHYGPTVKAFILYQHHQCRVPQHLIHEQLQAFGIGISTGQVNRILMAENSRFDDEQSDVLRAGLESATYVHTDDTGARHQGHNGYCTVVGNALFAYFKSSEHKSRQNYLKLMRRPFEDYVLNDYAQAYLVAHELAACHLEKLSFSEPVICQDESAWTAYLERLNIVTPLAVRLVTEAALLGSVIAHGVSPELIILSDGAPQFVLFVHALCWIHMERCLRKLSGDTPEQLKEIETLRYQLWAYYQALKFYRQDPSDDEIPAFNRCFDAIFAQTFEDNAPLTAVLKQFTDHKAELLRVLEMPRLPLHTNAAESDIREVVTRRKISGTTRHDLGQQARDTFIGLQKTCRKLGFSFWQYLTSRLKHDDTVPFLPDVIRQRAAQTTTLPLTA
jgi:Transposase IS66 family